MEATIPKVHIFMKYKIHSLNLNCLLQTAMHGLMVALKRARNVASKPFIRLKKLNFFTASLMRAIIQPSLFRPSLRIFLSTPLKLTFKRFVQNYHYPKRKNAEVAPLAVIFLSKLEKLQNVKNNECLNFCLE